MKQSVVALSLLVFLGGAGPGALAETKAKDLGAPLGCWRLEADTGWDEGREGDLICLEKGRIVLLGAGASDAWAVRWTKADAGWKARAIGTALLEQVDVHWLAGRDEKGTWFERTEQLRVRLGAVARADAKRAAERLGKTASPLRVCADARQCVKAAMAVSQPFRDMVEPDTIYGLKACSLFRDLARQTLRDAGAGVPRVCQ